MSVQEKHKTGDGIGRKGYTLRKCDECHDKYFADNRNLKRGWGLTCSKSCAAKKREKSKPGYSPIRVARNNNIRASWNEVYEDFDDEEDGKNEENYDPGDDEYWNGKEGDIGGYL